MKLRLCFLYIMFVSSLSAAASHQTITNADGSSSTNLRLYVEGGFLSTVPYVLSREVSPERKKLELKPISPFKYVDVTPEDIALRERRHHLKSFPTMNMSRAQLDAQRKVTRSNSAKAK